MADIASLVLRVDSTQAKQAEKDLNGLSTAGGTAEKSANGMTGAFRAAGAAIAALGLLRVAQETIKAADAFTLLSAQLKNATTSAQAYASAMEDVRRISTSAQVDIDTTAKLYARLSNSLRDAGTSQASIARITETVSLGLKVAGASAGETSSAMLQLSQAFGSGVLRGEEFNAMAEAAPNLLRILAESMNVPAGKLREMAADGELTSEALTKAFASEAVLDGLRKQAEGMKTVSGEMTVFSNELSQAMAVMSKEAGIDSAASSAVRSLTEYVRNLRIEFESGSWYDRFLAVMGANDSLEGRRRQRDAAKAGNVSTGVIGGRQDDGNLGANYGFLTGAELEKHNKEFERSQKKIAAAAEDRKKAATEQLAQLQEEIDLYGKSAVEIEVYKAAKAGANVIQIEEIRNRATHIEWLKDEQKQRDINAKLDERAKQRALDKAEEALRKQQQVHDDFWKSIDRTAHDTFVNMLEGGRNAATRLKDTFKSILFDWLYQMTLQKWIFNASANVTGGSSTGILGAASSMLGGGTGGGGIGSLLSAGQSMFSAISGGIGSTIGSIASTAGSMFGSAALSSFGQGASLYSGGFSIAQAGEIAGTAGTMGAGVAAAAPWIAGVMAFDALTGGALFGKSKDVTGPTKMQGQFSGAGFQGHYATPWYQSGGLFQASGGGVDLQPLQKDQIGAYSMAITEAKKAFDSLNVVLGQGITSLNGWSYSFDRVVNNQEQATALLKDMADSMGFKLNPAVSNFRRQGESLADTAMRLTQTFAVTDEIFKMMGKTISYVGLASVDLRQSLIDLFGGAQQATTAMQGYYNAFYSENEKTIAAWGQMAAMLRKIGVDAIPTTNAQFRALVEAQDLSTTAGQQMFTALVALAPTFDQLTKATDSLDQQTTNLTANLKQLATSGFKTLVDYTRALRLQGGSSGGAFRNQLAGVFAGAPAATTPLATNAASIAPSSATVVWSATNPNPDKIAARQVAISSAQAAIDRIDSQIASLGNSDLRGITRALQMKTYNNALEKAKADMAAAQALPTFAAGGLAKPGWALVGEQGPELVNFSQPGRVYTADQTKAAMSSSDGVAAEIRALRDELRAGQMSIAVAVQKSAKILDRWNGEGMPEVREAV